MLLGFLLGESLVDDGLAPSFEFLLVLLEHLQRASRSASRATEDEDGGTHVPDLARDLGLSASAEEGEISDQSKAKGVYIGTDRLVRSP